MASVNAEHPLADLLELDVGLGESLQIEGFLSAMMNGRGNLAVAWLDGVSPHPLG
jgi:hypothetical protein